MANQINPIKIKRKPRKPIPPMLPEDDIEFTVNVTLRNWLQGGKLHHKEFIVTVSPYLFSAIPLPRPHEPGRVV